MLGQGNRKVGEMPGILLFVIYQTPSPTLPLGEGKGARRAGRSVYSVKIVDSTKMFDFAIVLDVMVVLLTFYGLIKPVYDQELTSHYSDRKK